MTALNRNSVAVDRTMATIGCCASKHGLSAIHRQPHAWFRYAAIDNCEHEHIVFGKGGALLRNNQVSVTTQL